MLQEIRRQTPVSTEREEKHHLTPGQLEASNSEITGSTCCLPLMLLITPAVDAPDPSDLLVGAANWANSVAIEALVIFAG
jgi:hypothetical protein